MLARAGFAGCGFAPASQRRRGARHGGPLGTGNASGTGLVGGGAAQNGQGAITGMNCAAVDQPLNKLPPDILIVLDASGSMNEDVEQHVVHRRLRRELQVGAADAGDQQVVMETQADGELGSQVVRGHGQHLRRRPQQRRGARSAPTTRRRSPTAIAGRTDANGGVTNGSRTPTRSAENAAVTYLDTVTDLEPEVHPAGDRRPAELPPPAATPTRTTRRARSMAVPTRRPRAFRPSSSASRPRRAPRTTRSTAWRTRAVTRAPAAPATTR